MRIENIKHRICCKCAGFMDSHPEFTMIREWLKCRICGFTKKDKIMFITEEDFLKGREVANPLTDEMKANMSDLLEKMNKLMDLYGKTPTVTSGYRPAAINAATPGAAKASHHMMCRAIDLADMDGEIATWCLKNLDQLKKIGLWMEDPRWTHDGGKTGKNWTHLQTVAPKSGKRIFIPSSAPATDNAIWNGVYNKEND